MTQAQAEELEITKTIAQRINELQEREAKHSGAKIPKKARKKMEQNLLKAKVKEIRQKFKLNVISGEPIGELLSDFQPNSNDDQDKDNSINKEERDERIMVMKIVKTERTCFGCYEQILMHKEPPSPAWILENMDETPHECSHIYDQPQTKTTTKTVTVKQKQQQQRQPTSEELKEQMKSELVYKSSQLKSKPSDEDTVKMIDQTFQSTADKLAKYGYEARQEAIDKAHKEKMQAYATLVKAINHLAEVILNRTSSNGPKAETQTDTKTEYETEEDDHETK